MKLREFIERMARLEDKEHLYKPEYLRLKSEDDELEEMCERMECERCPDPESYCRQVLSDLEKKAELYSAANRILEALQRRGSYALLGMTEAGSEKESPDFRVSEYGENFCERCQMYGKAECPEDVYAPACARRETVKAVDSVFVQCRQFIRVSIVILCFVLDVGG